MINDGTDPARRAELASALSTVAYVALAVPVIGVGVLAQHIGLHRAVDLFTVIAAVLGTGLLVAMDRSRRRSASVAAGTAQRGAVTPREDSGAALLNRPEPDPALAGMHGSYPIDRDLPSLGDEMGP
jgi:hypothetical protein